jgi:hypothetical protein
LKAEGISVNKPRQVFPPQSVNLLSDLSSFNSSTAVSAMKSKIIFIIFCDF